MKKSIILLLALALVWACGNNSNPETLNQLRIDILQNIAKENTSAYQAVATQANHFNSSVLVFNANINQNNLKTLRTEWKKLNQLWQQSEIFNVAEVKYNLLHSFIYQKADTAKVEQKINTNTAINTDYIASLGASQKGIETIGYLLYSETDITEIVQKFQANNKRLQYLESLSADLKNQLNALSTQWQNKYEKTFLERTDLGVGSTISDLINQSIDILRKEYMQIEDVIKINNYQTFGYFGKADIQQSIYRIKATQDLFKGFNGKGFDDYLNEKQGKSTISDAINTQFDSLLQAFDKVKTQDYNALNNTQLNELKEEIKKLIQLYSVDLSNEMSIIITPSETDGD